MRPMIGMSWLVVLALLAGCQAETASPTAKQRSQPRVRDASDQLFDELPVARLTIELDEAAAQKLRENPRAYVKARIVENGQTTYSDVAIKLKGAAGSFQELDGKPGFTLNFGKHAKGQTFHAVRKLHLNNAVQDDTYLCEALAARLCQEAGLPAARVTHARVWLNDRDLGLYVLKEGFDEHFLRRHFRDPTGNLYDGGFCTDIDSELEKDDGQGPDDRSDLQKLVEACREPDEKLRIEKITQCLDIDAFVNFMALELMMCHWDGYTYNTNNYRVYFDPESKKAHFLPHGMDQMFQDPGFALFMPPGPIVSSAVMSSEAWKQKYIARVEELLPRFTAESLTAEVDELDVRLKPVFEALGEEAVAQHTAAVGGLKERLVARANNLREQLKNPVYVPPPPPEPLAFDEQGQVEIGDLHLAAESEDTQLHVEDTDEGKIYSVAIGSSGHGIGYCRADVRLVQGRYRVIGSMRTEGVVPIEDDRGQGAGLRISGAARENKLVEDCDWTDVMFEFEVVEEAQDIQLVAELRANAGKMWLRAPLQLERVIDPLPLGEGGERSEPGEGD